MCNAIDLNLETEEKEALSKRFVMQCAECDQSPTKSHNQNVSTASGVIIIVAPSDSFKDQFPAIPGNLSLILRNDLKTQWDRPEAKETVFFSVEKT